MSVDEKILSSDIDNISTPTATFAPTYAYHTSVCGSLLYTSPTKTPSDIFSYLRHSNFDAFRRSIDIYYNDIIQIVNDHGQVKSLLIAMKTFSFSLILLIFRQPFIY